MRRIKVKDIIIPTISLFIICVIITAALAFTNALTKDTIAKNELNAQNESMKTVCSDADTFQLVSENDDGDIYAALDKNGNVVGYAVSTQASGYGGVIKVMTGISADSTIIGIDVFYNDDETPGLGKNTSNESFTSQFKDLITNENIVVSKDYAGEGQQVDAVTSSTISSRAVTDAVNKARELYNTEILGGES